VVSIYVTEATGRAQEVIPPLRRPQPAGDGTIEGQRLPALRAYQRRGWLGWLPRCAGRATGLSEASCLPHARTVGHRQRTITRRVGSFRRCRSVAPTPASFC